MAAMEERVEEADIEVEKKPQTIQDHISGKHDVVATIINPCAALRAINEGEQIHDSARLSCLLLVLTEDYEGGYEPSKIQDMLINMEANFQAWADVFAASILGNNYSNPLWKYVASLKAMNPKTALSVAKMAFLGDQRPLLEQVQLPCTIIQCTNDVGMPTSVGCFIQSKMKGKTTLELVEAEGHFPHVTAPQAFIQIIDKVFMQ